MEDVVGVPGANPAEAGHDAGALGVVGVNPYPGVNPAELGLDAGALLGQELADLLRSSPNPVHLAGLIVELLNEISSKNAVRLHKNYCFDCGVIFEQPDVFAAHKVLHRQDEALDQAFANLQVAHEAGGRGVGGRGGRGGRGRHGGH